MSNVTDLRFNADHNSNAVGSISAGGDISGNIQHRECNGTPKMMFPYQAVDPKICRLRQSSNTSRHCHNNKKRDALI